MSQALVHFVIDCANLVTDHRISGRPIRAKYKHFRQFETILQHISILLLYSGGHRCREWILCRVVESSCLLTHNIAPHISLHDPPYHKTMKKYEDFEGMIVSLFPPRKFAIHTWFCNCPQYFDLLRIDVECTPSIHDSRKDVGSPKSTSLLSSFHIGSRFCFFPANFMSSTYTDKNNPFSRCTKRHSQFGIFSQPYCNRIFSNCLSHYSPAKG